MTEHKTPAAKPAESKAEAKAAPKDEELTLVCTCGQEVRNEHAAEQHREKCTGQWLAEAEQVEA